MLRIIGGVHKRKRIHSPPGEEITRPIPDRVREAVFNLLRGHFEGEKILDVFAGSGSFGLEAFSRGASHVVMVEQDELVAKIIKENIDLLDGGDICEVVQADALGPLALSRAPRPVHIVNFDPPYPLMRDPQQRERVMGQFARAIDLLDEKGFAIIRTPCPNVDLIPNSKDPEAPSKKVDIDMSLDNAVGPETHEYGTTAVHLYMRKQE